MSPLPCKNCFTGTLRGDATPTGTVTKLHGLDVYVARPPPPTGDAQPAGGIIVIITDFFGWELRNTRALADAYARRTGCLVYVPDFMDGRAPAPEYLLVGDAIDAPSTSWVTTLFWKPLWYLKFAVAVIPRFLSLRDSITLPRMERFLRAVRASGDPEAPPLATTPTPKPPRIGVAGFCWGGRYGLLMCSSEEALVDCGFIAHPGMIKVPDEIRKVRKPLSLANGDDDEFMRREKMQLTVRILEEEERGGIHDAVVYPGARHGFAVRGNPLDPSQNELGMQAEDQAVRWFKRHLVEVA